MSVEDVKKELLTIFEDIGVIVDQENDFDIQDYIMDSLVYMSFIISVEQKLVIEIPDEFLLISHMMSFNAYCESLLMLLV